MLSPLIHHPATSTFNCTKLFARVDTTWHLWWKHQHIILEQNFQTNNIVTTCQLQIIYAINNINNYNYSEYKLTLFFSMSNYYKVHTF